jgi:photoactive yellow protein
MNLDHQLAVADMINKEHLRPDRVGDGKDRITVDALDPAQLDSLPFGAIQLNHEGIILQYNDYESRFAGVDQSRAVGKNFFTEIAPCTDVKEFRGRFTEGVARKQLHEIFQYHFAFKKNPQDVTVSPYYSGLTDSTWVFIRPL